MVSHHPDWADVDDGYRQGSVGVFVRPAIVETGSQGSSIRAGGISDDQANAYSVSVRTGMGTASETWDSVANFDTPRTAWEFANLITHYFEAKHAPGFAKSDLVHGVPDYSGESDDLPDLVEDMTAQEAFVTLLDPQPIPEPMRNLLDDG